MIVERLRLVDHLPDNRRYRPRPILIQRQIIELLDFLDPQRIRFPDPNERGKLPAPAGVLDHKRCRQPFRAARFRFAPGQEEDPRELIRTWMDQFTGHVVTRTDEEHLLGIVFRVQWLSRVHCHLEMRYDDHRPDRVWVELNAWLQHRPSNTRRPVSTSGKALAAVNDLLRLLDRPTLIDNNQTTPR